MLLDVSRDRRLGGTKHKISDASEAGYQSVLSSPARSAAEMHKVPDFVEHLSLWQVMTMIVCLTYKTVPQSGKHHSSNPRRKGWCQGLQSPGILSSTPCNINSNCFVAVYSLQQYRPFQKSTPPNQTKQNQDMLQQVSLRRSMDLMISKQKSVTQ